MQYGGLDYHRYLKYKGFWNRYLDELEGRYPALFEKNVGLVMVLHAFEDKHPLIECLAERGLLLAAAFLGAQMQAERQTLIPPDLVAMAEQQLARTWLPFSPKFSGGELALH